MTDYIKKDDVLNIAIKARLPMDIQEEEPDLAWVRGFNGALNSVYHLPAADVRPVVQGRWESVGHIDNTLLVSRCSACGYQTIDAGRYCTECGADMVTNRNQLEEDEG